CLSRASGESLNRLLPKIGIQFASFFLQSASIWLASQALAAQSQTELINALILLALWRRTTVSLFVCT
ncbi:MAG: hypothetical protein AAF394_11215, partial [Planctomycetota bacterium]